MQAEFEYVQQVTLHFHQLAENPALLLAYLNQLEKPEVQALLDKYDLPRQPFTPIHLLRMECLRQMLAGIEISIEKIEEVKQRIRQKNGTYFAHLDADTLEKLQEYPLINRDVFHRHQKPWSIFLPLLFEGEKQAIFRSNLERIGQAIKAALGLEKYVLKIADFRWSAFGSNTASLALHLPMGRGRGNKVANQFMLKFSDIVTAGKVAGQRLPSDKMLSTQLWTVKSYSEVLEIFERVKSEVVLFNDKLQAAELAEDGGNLLIETDTPLLSRIQEPTESSYLGRYRYEDDPERPFIPTEQFIRLVHLLKRKRNLILQGPPGVGKTFLASKLAYALMGFRDTAQIQRLQFHQSYSYEDFVQGLRPGVEGGFELRNGVFYEFCQLARQHPDRSYFLIIDEINRGNLSRIFGELLQLIESDKRSEVYAMRLTYSKPSEPVFFIPPNLYLIGTMNTADRSLAIIDYALRRRFAFVDVEPCFEDAFVAYALSQGLSERLALHIATQVLRLNEEIARDPNLGRDFRLGHSYFCTYNPAIDEGQWYQEVLRYEILPMLEEMWFDQPERVDRAFQNLEFTRS